MRELQLHIHQDDFHGLAKWDVEDASEAADIIVATLKDRYDISAVTFDGQRWERIPYGCGWAAPLRRGWQPCPGCGSSHPVTSEC